LYVLRRHLALPPSARLRCRRRLTIRERLRLGLALSNPPAPGARANLQFRPVSHFGANRVERSGSVQLWLETDYILPLDLIGYGVNCIFQSTLF
jgi:hypothetical protein